MHPTLPPDQVIRHMEVPGEPGLYVIGCFERRVTLYSQQVRALNLVYALHEEKRLRPGDEVAVVGGGAAGMTAAAGAATLGYKVTLLEKGSVLLPLLRGNHIRWVYPHLYDWPAEGSDRLDAGLPLLDWRAALAYRVADQLDEAWRKLRHLSRIEVVHNVRSIDLDVGSPRRVTWNPRPARPPGKFAAVILAVGFGLERTVKSTPWLSYWDDDRLHQPTRREGRARHLVSGCGDGGLIDLIRVCVRDFRHETLIDKFLAPVPRSLQEKLLGIDEEARLQKDPSVYLDEQYQALAVPEAVDAAFGELRADTEAVLNGREASALTLGASILNRFLASRLLNHFGIDYRRGEISVRRLKGRHAVTIGKDEPEVFDHVTCRHGTGPSALEKSFRGVWEKCGPMQARSALDQTRWPIYGKAFDLGPPAPAPGGGPPPPTALPAAIARSREGSSACAGRASGTNSRVGGRISWTSMGQRLQLARRCRGDRSSSRNRRPPGRDQSFQCPWSAPAKGCPRPSGPRQSSARSPSLLTQTRKPVH